ncbi:transposable element Tcb1 transposase [Trichonephila clavipes]|nr:transposable element Tcb1 transposase [Trichonephila clavipes]
MASVAEWYRYRILSSLVTSSSPVPLKSRRVGQRCTLNLSRAQTSSCWTSGSGRCHLHEDRCSARPRQTNRPEDPHIVRNARVQPTASLAAIHRTGMQWNGTRSSLATNPDLISALKTIVFGCGKPRGECLKPAFVLQPHTTPTTSVMVWGDIAYNTRSPLVLIRGTMRAQRYVYDILKPHVLPLMQRLPGAIFSTRQCSASYGKEVTRLSLHCYYPSLACPIPIFVSNRAYLGSFGTASWASHEFERTRGKVTENMEPNVSRHHTELVSLNARSYRIVHSR